MKKVKKREEKDIIESQLLYILFFSSKLLHNIYTATKQRCWVLCSIDYISAYRTWVLQV